MELAGAHEWCPYGRVRVTLRPHRPEALVPVRYRRRGTGGEAL